MKKLTLFALLLALSMKAAVVPPPGGGGSSGGTATNVFVGPDATGTIKVKTNSTGNFSVGVSNTAVVTVTGGSSLATAIASASNDTTITTIYLMPGRYTNATFIRIPTNCALIGESPLSTIIVNQDVTTNNGNIHPGIVFSSGSRLANVTVTNSALNTACQACFGANGAAGDLTFTNASMENCIGYGDCDVLVVQGTNCTLAVRNCLLFSKWDATIVNGTNTVNYHNCNIQSIGPSVYSSGQASRALVTSSGGKINVFGGNYFATNSGASAFAVAANNSQDVIKLYGGTYRGNANTPAISPAAPNIVTVYGAQFDESTIDHAINVLSYGSIDLITTNIFSTVDIGGGTPTPITVTVNDGNNFFVVTITGTGGLTLPGSFVGLGTSNYLSGNLVVAGNITVGGAGAVSTNFSLQGTIFANNAVFTNGEVTLQTSYPTNSGAGLAADFSKENTWLTTNASFTFLAPINVRATNDETTVTTITNSSGSTIQITCPTAGLTGAQIITNGIWNCTNGGVTKITWHHDGSYLSNAVASPIR